MSYNHTRINSQTLKEWIRPEDFYSREQENFCHHRGTWVEGGLCPFHNDKSAGSFRVNLESGAYKCFSCGAKGGDIIAFTQQKHGLGFREAMAKLKREWGVL
jgi:DNA primase